MRKPSLFNKFMFFSNVLAALLLLVACAVPYISDERFSFLAFLSLGVPALVVANALFLLYWGIRRKKQIYVSLFVLVLGYFLLGTFVKFQWSEEPILEEDLSVMSYNVRGFNKFGELESKTIFEDIKAFVEKENPDVICFQEPGYLRRKEYTNYPHKYLEYIHLQGKTLLGIFSKHPIVATGLVNFPETPNNAAYADILYKNDTIRIYSVHLQSLGITPGHGIIRKEPSEKLIKMLNSSFKKQQQQAKILQAHRATVGYKTIVCGDFNNTQFSNAYKIIKGDLHDTFIEEGTGYGRTLVFHDLPVRIDFILADKAFKVKSHKNYDVKYSDHFPVMASFEVR